VKYRCNLPKFTRFWKIIIHINYKPSITKRGRKMLERVQGYFLMTSALLYVRPALLDSIRER